MAPSTMPTTTPREVQSQGRPGRLTSTAQGAYARRPPPTTATMTPTTLQTMPRSQVQPTRPTRQHETARGAYAWQSPVRAQWQRDRDGTTATWWQGDRNGADGWSNSSATAMAQLQHNREQGQCMRRQGREHWLQGSGPAQASGPQHNNRNSATATRRRCDRNGSDGWSDGDVVAMVRPRCLQRDRDSGNVRVTTTRQRGRNGNATATRW
jgi:hypothetical protein